MPDDYLIKGCQLCSMGFGQPMFQNSDVIVSALLAQGEAYGRQVTLEDARNATDVGCQEPYIVGKDGLRHWWRICTPMALELALNNGVNRLYNRKMGVETGDPRQFKSFEEVQEAYKKQLAWFIRNTAMVGNIKDRTLAEMRPTVYRSALIEDCIEKGLSAEEGGAHYNPGGAFYSVGLPDIADSLTAIKKLVFEDRKITMDQLCDALDKNFEGYDNLRQMLLAAPKFGNDDDYADEQMVWASHELASEVAKQKNIHDGRCVTVSQGFWDYVRVGKPLGALPSGRLAGEPLATGSGPCEGKAVMGPTAVLRSLGKVNNIELSHGTVNNMRLDPAVFRDADGYKRLAALLRTLVDENIFHTQFNVVSSDTLRAAQREPDEYKDLIVRVAGYSAYFVHLSEEMQNEIIARTEHTL
jgi:formate C-acetyltransferase